MTSSDSASVHISQTIEKLRRLTQINVQADWYYCIYIKEKYCQDIDSPDWQPVELNDKGYITWSAGRQVRWLAQRFVVPDRLHGYPLTGLTLRLVLTWWAELAQIYVNGHLVQEGDLFDSAARVLLSAAAAPGEEIMVTIRLVSPGHDIGALMKSICVYEREGDELISIDPGFVADELTVLQKYLDFAPEELSTLASALSQIDWETVSDAGEFERSLGQLRQTLLPLAEGMQHRSLHLLGHAHLDLAWLWTVDETWEVAERTFRSVLDLQQEFPLTFCHSTPALYAWIEEHRPDLFKEIQAAVADGRWEVVGGMWVEPEVNLPSGESLVRQLLYGQRYMQEKFGAIASIAWLPDSFGFSWQLPQIFHQAGIEYFVTGKLHWNDTTIFPHGIFWWQSPDGTRLLTLMSPPNLAGVMDTNPVIMSLYGFAWEKQTGLTDAFWLPGVGDHGGGPSRDMLAIQQKAARSPFFPRLQWTTANEYLQHISQLVAETASSHTSFPIWNTELYLELHRGCYTTHAEQKRFNRFCESLLYQAELWAALATLTLGAAYPKKLLEEAWKKVLFNQFHDILPGTSIPEVFVDANAAWQEAQQLGEQIVEESLEAIAAQISLPTPPQPSANPIIVFNSLNWERSEVVTCPLPDAASWRVCDLDGQMLPSQQENNTLLFEARNIPSVGYRLFWLVRQSELNDGSQEQSEFILENETLRVVVDPETGDLSRVFDKVNQREVLSSAGNQLQAFQDRGQYWDAWNIDPNYAEHPLPPSRLKSLQWLERGPLQWRVRAVRQIEQSEFCQDYILQAGSLVLKIATTVNWRERHILVKAAFPLTVKSDRATYEIPCGVVERSSRPQTAAEKAKWEVPALRWADITDSSQNYGVSLLNDCKYGYDCQPNQIRLTLLRGSTWPDPEADQGVHRFTYALYPHRGSWQTAHTVRQGYQLNVPLKTVFGKTSIHSLPPIAQLLNLQAENLILMALKQSEDDPHAWIGRCYECHGETAPLSLASDLKVAIAGRVDLLERSLQHDASIDDGDIQPWKIVSFRLS